MKLILHNDEIVNFLIDLFCNNRKVYNFPECTFALAESVALYHKTVVTYDKHTNKKFNAEKVLQKLTKQINVSVETDLKNWRDSCKTIIEERKNKYKDFLKKNFESVVDKIGEEKLFEAYKKHKSQNFVKSVGQSISTNYDFVRIKNYTDITEDCLLRNMEGNESMLLNKINGNYPFWFIDTGYTNFLNGKKKIWHRLTRNHIHHHFNAADVPVDRLGNFEKFPKPWRQDGEKILVIEPGLFSANIFKVDIKTWRDTITKQIREHSDKPIVFREKIPRKSRAELYEHLLDEDYYCVININSNASIESVWSGIPIITLDKHITNPISRNSISDINNLLRPNIANWIAMLSYSQFTRDELVDGTAMKILRTYHL